MDSILMKEGLAKKLFDTAELKQALFKILDHQKEHKKKIPYEELSELELYYLDTFGAISQVDDKLNELSTCAHFISYYPSKLKIGKVMTRHKYIIYHLEYYYIGIIALHDRILKLINQLCNLGLDDRDTSYEVITRHQHLGSGLKKQLKKFYKSTQGIRKLQNSIKHKRGMVVEDLSNPSLFEFVSRTREISEFKPEHYKELEEIAKKGYKAYISKKTKELKANDKALYSFVMELLKELDEPFNKRVRELSG